MIKTIKTQILLRRSNLNEWESLNPVLGPGEIGVALDVGRCKLGNGNTHWKDLPFFLMAPDVQDYAKIVIKTQQEWLTDGFVKSIFGQIYIYTKENDNGELSSARMKVGDGKSFIFNLPFVSDSIKQLLENHIQNKDIHVTPQEKEFWSNKVNINNTSGVIENTLIFNRN